jgi:glycosyltransferase involved in cell wall biosynthesis
VFWIDQGRAYFWLINDLNTMTVNIHLIRTNRPHWGKFSGINQFVKHVDANQYSIDMHMASDNDDDFPIQNLVVRKLLREYVQKKGMKYYKLSDLTAEIKTFIKSFSQPIDIIHYLDGEHSAQYLTYAYRLSRQRPKLVAMYHQPPDLLGSLTREDVIRRLDAIIVVSPEQVPYFKELVEPEKIHLILHGIDTSYFKPSDQPKENDKFRCITVGHWLRDFKAVRLVAERLTPYKDIEFHVISSKRTGPQELGLEDLSNVTLYRDTIDDDSLVQQLQRSHALFLPLLASTANNALLEGLAAGLPVISTALPSVKAYVPGEQALLVENNDPDQLADVILHLYKNPIERQKMEAKSRQRAEELDWKNIAPLYEAVYSQVINN